MDRRTFLQLLASLGVGSLAPTGTIQAGSPRPGTSSDRLGVKLPMRQLGRNGPEVTCLGLGGYHIGWTTERLAQETIEVALEEGIRFFDTAESYGPETSELRYGQWLTPVARDEIFLMTKSTGKTAADVRKDIEGSLRRLNVDSIDLWQLHSLQSEEDVDSRIDAGVLDEALKAQQDGKLRYLGFTGHASPYALKRILERTDGDASPFQACQFPVNPVDAAASHSFIQTVMPAANHLGIGVIAMKILADGRFFDHKIMQDREVWRTENPVIPDAISIRDCLQFALSLPIAVAMAGAEKPEFVRDKVAIVREFQNLSESDRKSLVARVAAFAADGSVEYYKAKDLRS